MGARYKGTELPDFLIKFYIHFQYFLHYPQMNIKNGGNQPALIYQTLPGRHNVSGYITYINPLTVACVEVIQSFNDTLGPQ